MAVDLRGVTAVLLPGTGSDDDYVYRAFSAALHDVGAVVVAPPPQPDRLIDGYIDALDNAARRRRSRWAGCPSAPRWRSIGRWPIPARAVAVLAALPPWTGSPDTAPAAQAARYSADVLRRDGLVSATSQMRASSPAWLADELTRSWVGQWPSLPDAMEEASRYVSPTCAELERLTVPMGVAAATDDPVHPWRSGWSGWPRRRGRRCGRSRWTRWAPTRRCWARRAWPPCWTSEPALAAGDGAQLLHRRPVLTATRDGLRLRRLLLLLLLRPAGRRPAVGGGLQLLGHRLGQLHRKRGAHRQRRVAATNNGVRQGFPRLAASASMVSCGPFTTQRIIHR